MNKYIKITVTVLVLISVLALPCSALSFNSTYSDVVQSSTQANNLIALALNYPSFFRSDYIVFCPNQYQYYIVWGDLTVSAGNVTSSGAVEYISYIRGADYNSNYVYHYDTSSNFSLYAPDVCTSNIDNFGMKSQFYDGFFTNYVTIQFYIFGLGVLMVILFLKLRKG